MKHLFAVCAAAGLMMLASNASAQSSPDDVAARCANLVGGIVERCQGAAADETGQCVRKINALLDAGRDRAARRLAAECIRSATARTDNCAHRVKRVCDLCIDTLLNMGAPDLARRVNNICEDAITALRTTLQREKAAIRGAFS